MQTIDLPLSFQGVGYTKHRAGLPLEPVTLQVPAPSADEVVIRVSASSLNPLEYKLADLNFLGRTPPVGLGFDVAGVIVAIGSAVKRLSVGDVVVAMTDLNGNGGWVPKMGSESYVLARDFLTVVKPSGISFAQAAALPMCFLSAYASIYENVKSGDTVYIPGGGGGVGHLAIQMASRVLGAGKVISSGSTLPSMQLARESGAKYVYNYKKDKIDLEIARLTGGNGVDVVYDATYNEQSFIETARTVRSGGKWIVLGVGPGNTTRLTQTISPVDSILKEKGAAHINVNILRYFTEPALLTGHAKDFLHRGLTLCMEWANQGLVVPHIGRKIESSVTAISTELQRMKDGGTSVGKTVVIVDEKSV